MQANKGILLIEDDEVIRELYQEVLTEAGFLVDPARDGEEGLTKTLQGGYRLILLDIMMPKLDGIEFLSRLENQQPSIQNGPIVLLTNLAHDEILNEGLEKGAHSYLVKADLDPSQLVEYVTRLIA